MTWIPFTTTVRHLHCPHHCPYNLFIPLTISRPCPNRLPGHNLPFVTGSVSTTIDSLAFGFYLQSNVAATFKIALMHADASNLYLPTVPYTILASDSGLSAPLTTSAGFTTLQMAKASFPNIGGYVLQANTSYNIVVFASSSSGLQISHSANGVAASIVYAGGATYPPTTNGACYTGYFQGTDPAVLPGGSWMTAWAHIAYCMNFHVALA